MEELKLFRGDTVRLKGKRGKETVCICLQDEGMDSNNIKMNKVSKDFHISLNDFMVKFKNNFIYEHIIFKLIIYT